MAEPSIHRSQRFTKAARAELGRLARKRARIADRRERLQGEIDQLDEELEAINCEAARIEELTTSPHEADEVAIRRAQQGQGPNRLSGYAIRAAAVPLLLRERGTAPIHYREWLELMSDNGYAVEGKRPDAVFLNQVVRSPLVRSTTQSGYYVLDPAVVEELTEELRRQQLELSSRIAEVPEDPEAYEEFREKNRRMNTAIARTERRLDEALAAVHAAGATQGSSVKAA